MKQRASEAEEKENDENSDDLCKWGSSTWIIFEEVFKFLKITEIFVMSFDFSETKLIFKLRTPYSIGWNKRHCFEVYFIHSIFMIYLFSLMNLLFVNMYAECHIIVIKNVFSSSRFNFSFDTKKLKNIFYTTQKKALGDISWRSPIHRFQHVVVGFIYF